MTNSKLALLLLVIACVMFIAWARPRSRSSIFNEVTSLPAERRMSNDILDQISPMRRPSKRSFMIKHPVFPRLKMPRRYIREGLYNELQPEIAPGGMNFYSNDVLPLSTFELLEPDTLY